MPASEARLIANKTNAARSTGPRTVEGKANSRANAYKHGLTGHGTVVNDEDSSIIKERSAELQAELRPSGPTGRMLVERLAVLSIRMERAAVQETAAISEHVRRALADFEAPEGLDEKTVAMLRHEAGEIALFDPSKEACLARKYEAAAQRAFFRALNELRQLGKEAKAEPLVPESAETKATLGSLLQMQKMGKLIETLPTAAPRPIPSKASRHDRIDDLIPQRDRFDVPIAIGRAH